MANIRDSVTFKGEDSCSAHCQNCFLDASGLVNQW